MYQPVSVISGHGYSLRFWARASVAQEISLHLYSTSCPYVRCLSDTRVALTTTWQPYEISFTASGTAVAAGLNFFVTVPGTVWLDDVSLREGDTAVYRRDFDSGVVVLNYTNTTRTVDLGGSFQRLSIPGSSVYDGATVTSEVVPPSDGRIFLRLADASPAPLPPEPQSKLHQNEPNPFNPSTRIRFELSQDGPVHLAVYDLAGRLVRTLVNKPMMRGANSVVWGGTDHAGRQVRSGVYFYRITTPTFTDTRKLTLIK